MTHDQLAERIRARLAQPDGGGSGPLGWITRSRAEHLGHALAAAGGWVAKDTLASPALETLGQGRYLASGEGAPANREVVRLALRAEFARWEAKGQALETIEEHLDAMIGILDLIERAPVDLPLRA